MDILDPKMISLDTQLSIVDPKASTKALNRANMAIGFKMVLGSKMAILEPKMAMWTLKWTL